MKQDIKYPKVENIAMAIVQREDPLEKDIWDVYVLNFKKELIHNVMVASKGYGTKNGKEVKTSILRHYIEEIGASTYAKVEPIQSELFSINNEFWLSFYLGKTIYDKRYVFLAESVIEANLIEIPMLGRKGVMIR